MANKASEVRWYGNDVSLAIEGAAADVLKKAAFRIEEHTKINIRDNKQIDTGFMLNSVYAFTRDMSNYGQTQPSGKYRSSKTGEMVEQERSPEVQLPRDAEAGVAVGAAYAIYQEASKPFLFPALEDVQREMGGIIQETKREKRL